MIWADLFERATEHHATEAEIREALARRRTGREGDGGSDEGTLTGNASDAGRDTDPMARIVADADVLAADLLVGGPSREALDLLRAHDWLSLLASEPLLADAEAVIADIADEPLALTWRGRIADLAVPVAHPGDDHPALATAMRGDARQVLSLDPDLASVGAGVAIRREANVETSVRSPHAFVSLFDAPRIYETIYDEAFSGREP